jgi:hypothetical protein
MRNACRVGYQERISVESFVNYALIDNRMREKELYGRKREVVNTYISA